MLKLIILKWLWLHHLYFMGFKLILEEDFHQLYCQLADNYGEIAAIVNMPVLAIKQPANWRMKLCRQR